MITQYPLHSFLPLVHFHNFLHIKFTLHSKQTRFIFSRDVYDTISYVLKTTLYCKPPQLPQHCRPRQYSKGDTVGGADRKTAGTSIIYTDWKTLLCVSGMEERLQNHLNRWYQGCEDSGEWSHNNTGSSNCWSVWAWQTQVMFTMQS